MTATNLRAKVGRAFADCAGSGRWAAIGSISPRTGVLRTAPSSPPQSAERGVVGPGLARSGGTQGLEELLVEGGIGLCEPVEAPPAVPLVDDQPRLAKVRQVPRCRGLRNPQNRDEIADAERTFAQQMEDADARRVRKGPEHLFD
jgi:hypothetical protein